MIGTSLPEYVFIRTSILGLRAITPFSIFYCSISIADPPRSPFRKLLLAWAIVETAFFVLVYFPRKRALQAAANHPPPLSRDERKELFWRCWDKIPNPEYYLSKWFLGAKTQDIRRENVKDFYRWALLNQGARVGGLKDDEVEAFAEEEEELEGYAEGIETLLGRKLEPGRGTAKCLRLTIDEVKISHRPFLWYMVRLFVLPFWLASANALGRLLDSSILSQPRIFATTIFFCTAHLSGRPLPSSLFA